VFDYSSSPGSMKTFGVRRACSRSGSFSCANRPAGRKEANMIIKVISRFLKSKKRGPLLSAAAPDREISELFFIDSLCYLTVIFISTSPALSPDPEAFTRTIPGWSIAWITSRHLPLKKQLIFFSYFDSIYTILRHIFFYFSASVPEIFSIHQCFTLTLDPS